MEQKTVLKGFSIVVVDRGFVFVGNIEHDGEWCIVSNARNLRRWGTSGGLGELASNGPTDETTIDNYGTVRIPGKSVIALIDSEESKWKR